MNYKINDRVILLADYILETNKTIREISKIFNISKSTVHKDLHERLKKIDKLKYNNVDKILKYHMSIRHINGGEVTRKKYLYLKNNIDIK